MNRWTESDHAVAYLERRDTIPHRAEGYEVLLELIEGWARSATGESVRVLDLGTGDGLLLGLVLDALAGATGVGVDFSAEMLTRARSRFAASDAVEIVEHDLESPLPESLGSFEVAVSAFAIHHLGHERKRALYDEVYERLTPGGLFAHLEHVASPTPALHAAFLEAIGTAPADDDPSNQLLDLDVQLRWWRDIGFADVDCFWKWRELALMGGVKPGR